MKAMRHDDPTVTHGDWYGLKAAVNAAGWALVLEYPARRPPRYLTYRDVFVREFASRDAVCDWLDAGAPEPIQMELGL